MSTSTLSRESRATTAMLFSTDSIARELTPRSYFKKSDTGADVLVLEDVAVFRSGTFRDSMGFQMTWESIHMDQMVAHFNMLRDRNIFGDVPVRDGHPGFLISGQSGNGKVIGWHTELRTEKRVSKHDGKEYDYLIARYEIMDPDAQRAIQSGLWRNRSAEVGTYVTNDDAEFWPVYMGVAYVDIPAVEGLNAFSKQYHASLMMEEGSMTSSTNEQKVTTPTVPTPPAPPAAPAAQETAPPAAQHAAQAEVQAFSINGEQVSDYGKVQAYIKGLESEVTSLRQFREEQTMTARKDFVAKLARDNRILATQVQPMEEFAIGLSPEQFESWSKAMELTPAQSVLGNYSTGAAEAQTPTPVGTTPEADRLDVARQVVQSHKRAGMPEDKIKETPSYKRLVAADPSFVL